MRNRVAHIANKGEKIYKHISGKFPLGTEGRFAAIDVESEEYYVGDTLLDAVMRAKRAYPDRKFHIVRIGHKAAVSFKHRYKL